MIVSTISFWLPLLWAIVVVTYWRVKMKEPVNHWLVCILVGAASFFFFAISFILFIILVILNSGILFKKDKTEDEPKS